MHILIDDHIPMSPAFLHVTNEGFLHGKNGEVMQLQDRATQAYLRAGVKRGLFNSDHLIGIAVDKKA